MAVKSPICIQFSGNNKTKPFPKVWQKCVGSCHAAMGLRADWREQLKFIHEELGITHVRFHGLLDDDMYVIETAKKINRFLPGSIRTEGYFQVDNVFDFILSIGMKLFVELSFMPTAMASGKRTVFHYKGNITPPKDYAEWGNLIERLARHWVERYGKDEVQSWYFEVWNEPDLKIFWAGNQAQYFELYKATALAIKKVDATLRVGGPATSRSRWIPEMIQFCEANHLPLDFVSTHHYPSDEAIGHGMRQIILGALKVIRQSRGKSLNAFFSAFLDQSRSIQSAGRDVMQKVTKNAKAQAGKYPLFYTEWNSNSACSFHLNDDPHTAAFIVKTIVDVHDLVDLYSFWTFSDLFEELSFFPEPFSGEFGMLSIHGIPKPSFWAFKLLSKLDEERIDIPVASGSASGSPTLEHVATKSKRGLKMLLYNYQVPLEPIAAETVSVEISDVPAVKSVSVEYIDENHGNPKKLWVAMGSPLHLLPTQVNQLKQQSAVVAQPLEYQFDPQAQQFKTALQVQPSGVALVSIEFE